MVLPLTIDPHGVFVQAMGHLRYGAYKMAVDPSVRDFPAPASPPPTLSTVSSAVTPFTSLLLCS